MLMFTVRDLLADTAHVHAITAMPIDTTLVVLPPASTLHEWAARRAALARLVADTDRAMAGTGDAPPPYVVVRDDGAVYCKGRRVPTFEQGAEPFQFTYKQAAIKRAAMEPGATVLPFEVWKATQQEVS